VWRLVLRYECLFSSALYLPAIGGPIAKLPVLVPYLSTSMTVAAEVGVHVMVTCSPAAKVPPRGAVMANGAFWAAT